MVEADKNFDVNQTGGIIKESFGDEEEGGGSTFQKEEITENDYNMGTILDRKLELNRGDYKTVKPLVGKRDVSEFAQPRGERLDSGFIATLPDAKGSKDELVLGNERVFSRDPVFGEIQDPSVLSQDNQNR